MTDETNSLAHPAPEQVAEASGREGRDPITHDVKTWPDAYDAVYADWKPWEFRKNDRDYRVGDTLRMLRWSPETETFTGEEMRREVVWMLNGGQFGIPEGYCIMTLSRTPSAQADRAEAERDFWMSEAKSHRTDLDDFAERLGATESLRSNAEAERDALREALEPLEPLAALADFYDGRPPTKYHGDTSFELHYSREHKVEVTVGDLRMIRAALAMQGEGS